MEQNCMNNEDFDNFYASIYKLAYITRYSGVPRIKDESVAEHSFFVAALVIKLHEAYDFDIGTALQMAISHDWAEAFIGDATHITKLAYPGIAQAMHEAEKEAIKSFAPKVYNLLRKYDEQSSVEAKVVAIADVIQVAQYAENEVKLGNTDYMIDVANSAYKRLERLKEQLNEFKR